MFSVYYTYIKLIGHPCPFYSSVYVTNGLPMTRLYASTLLCLHTHLAALTTNTKTESGLYSFIELFIYDYGFCNYTILYARQEYYHFQSVNYPPCLGYQYSFGYQADTACYLFGDNQICRSRPVYVARKFFTAGNGVNSFLSGASTLYRSYPVCQKGVAFRHLILCST